MKNTLTRKDVERRISAMYDFALAEEYQIIALGPGQKGQHHFLVKREESYLEVTLTSRGTFLLSTEQGMSVSERLTPAFLDWFDLEEFRYTLDAPFTDQACMYLAGETSSLVYAPFVAPQHKKPPAFREGDSPFMGLLPCPSDWFAVYALDPDGEPDGRFEKLPIIGWAMTNEETLLAGKRSPNAVSSVVALFVWGAVDMGSQPDAYPHVVSHDDELFVGYHYPGCTLDWKTLSLNTQKSVLQARQDALDEGYNQS